MKIIIPVAACISYNPATYLVKALKELGHETSIHQGQVHEDDTSVDLYLCVDSGGPLVVQDSWASRCAFWFIDSRRNCNPEVRNPDDDAQAEKIFSTGGWVFQAQLEDVERLKTKGVESHWLPLAADPDVWSNHPKEKKIYDIAFVGNCYDPVRLEVLSKLQKEFNLYWPGIEGAIMEDGAKVYRQSRVGFNISSFYGQGVDYDINMRVFEVMSCGVNLVTNHVPSLFQIPGLGNCPGVFCYHNLDEVSDTIRRALDFPQGCTNTRSSILANHTYTHRAKEILEIMSGKR